MTTGARFERQLPAVLEDLYLGPTPDYRDEVLAAATATRQRPAWTFPGRWLPMADIASRPAFAPRLPWRAIGVALVIIALIAAAAAVYVGSQHRVPPPFGPAGNGLVAFDRDGDLFVNDPATGQSRLLVGGDSQDTGLEFSPDGTRIAFVRAAPLGLGYQLFVGNADGTHLTALTPEPFEDISAGAFSPDGRSIAIESTTAGVSSVAIYATDGSGVTPIHLANAGFPAWRPPDGQELLVRGLGTDGQRQLFLVRPDGSDIRPLHVQNPGIGGPDWDLSGATWSPDGARIAYNSVDKVGADGSHFRVHIVRADGSADQALPGSAPDINEGWTNWSPDGRSLVVQRWNFDQPLETLGLIPADGHDAGKDIGPRLASKEDAFHVTWAPDGTRILAFSDASKTLVSINPVTGETSTPTWTTTDIPDWQRVAP